MKEDEIIEMARQAGLAIGVANDGSKSVGKQEEKSFAVGRLPLEDFLSFAKLVAAHAVAKDREEFDIDELCARQNKIGYKQGYNAGVLAEREACAKVCESHGPTLANSAMLAEAIRARGEA